MKRRYLFLWALLFIASSPLRAQFYMGVRGGVSLPQGYYAESRMSDNGWMFSEGHQLLAGAGKGWTAGLEMSFAMPFHPSLEVALSADFMQSGFNNDVKDYYEKVYSARYKDCRAYLMELPKLRNVPVLLGVRYAYPMTPGVDFYGEAMAGVNFRHIAPWNLAYATASWTIDESRQLPEYNNEDIRVYSDATTFAFRVGAGVMLKKGMTIGASFGMLGASPLSWTRTSTVRYDVGGKIIERVNTREVTYNDLNPTLVTVQLGYRFKPFKTKTVQDW